MHTFLTNLTLLLVALGAPASDDAPIVVRAYDIASAAPATQSLQGGTIPPIRSDQPDDLGVVIEGVRSPESCIEVLRALQPAEWELPGRMLEVVPDGRLFVHAPATTQEGVALTLGFMAETFGRRTHLVFDVITTKGGDVDALSARIPVEEIARWVSSATTHQSYDVEFIAGEHGWVRAQRALDTVRSFEAEIGERAVAFSPVPERLMTGLALECNCSPAAGGSWIALALQDVDTPSGVQEEDAGLAAYITTSNSIVPYHGPDRVQRVALDERIFALNAFLPDGKALAIRTALDMGGEKTTRIVFVHQEGSSSGAIARLPDNVKRALGARDAAFVRTDSYVIPRASMHTTIGEPGTQLGTLVSLYPKAVEELYVRPRIESDAANELLMIMTPEGDDRSITPAGAWAVLAGPDRAAIDSALARVSSLLPEVHSLQATLTLKRGAAAGKSIAQAVVPLRTGARSTVVFGRETTKSSATNSYIAQGASVSRRGATAQLDGIAVGIEPRVSATGEIVLVLDAHAGAPHGTARAFDAGVQASPTLIQQDEDVLDVQRSFGMGKSGAGSKHIVLGNTGSGDDALTLELDIVDLR